MLKFWFSFYQNYNKTERSVKTVYEHRMELKDRKEFKEETQSKVPSFKRRGRFRLP